MIQNIKEGKITTAIGLAVLVIVVLKLCGLDVAEKLGVAFDDAILYISAAITGVILLFTPDKLKKYESDKQNLE